MKFIIIIVLYFAATTYCNISDNFIGKVFTASWSQSEDKYKNIIVSPFSLVAPLGTLALASHGSTHKEILHVLDVTKTKQISESYSAALNELDQENSTKITTANRVYINYESKVRPDFYEKSKNEFGIEVVNANFDHPVKTAETINKWVERKTENLIKDLVSPESISSDTCVMLINTVYFEAKWAKSFKESRDREFHVNKLTKRTVSYMSVELYLPYMQSKVLNSEVLLIPYRKSKCSFMIIYPNSNVDIYTMRNKFRDRSVLGDITKDMEITNVKLYMPKFEFESRIDLKKILQKLNVKKMFTREANITKMVLSNDELYVSNAYQKAFIRVNEEGTQAAAANVMPMYSKSANPLVNFQLIVNRPFYFEIGCSDTQIFNGIIFKLQIEF